MQICTVVGGNDAVIGAPWEMIWPLFLWGFTSVALTAMVWRFCATGTSSNESLARGESGASYPLGFVMVLPLFLMLSLVWFEAGYLLLAKVACSRAAYSATRAAAVWMPMNQAGVGEGQVRLAARLALVPYGRIVSSNLPPTPSAWSASEVADQAEMAADSYGVMTGDNTAANSIAAKFTDVAHRTEVLIVADSVYDPSLNPDGEVEVSVIFQPQVLIPGVASIVQPGSLGKGYHQVQSRCVLPAEYPRNAQRSLSIQYRSPQ